MITKDDRINTFFPNNQFFLVLHYFFIRVNRVLN